VLGLASIDVAPSVGLLEERLPAFDLASEHLPSNCTGLCDNFDLTVNPEVVFLMISLKDPAKLLYHDSVDDAHTKLAEPSSLTVLRKSTVHKGCLAAVLNDPM
jgi:hypothetical protein